MQEKESQEKDNHNLYSQRCPAHSAGRTLLTLAGTESNCKQREKERDKDQITLDMKWKFVIFLLQRKKLPTTTPKSVRIYIIY